MRLTVLLCDAGGMLDGFLGLVGEILRVHKNGILALYLYEC
jgi:hypothetical protein